MQFNYTARTSEGQLQAGIVEASGFEDATEALQRHNLVIVSLKLASAGLWVKRLKFFEKIKKEDVMMFSRQLSVLLEADVPLVESLKILTKETENIYFKEIIFEITSDVEASESLFKFLY